ncbi:hypothetical protein TNCV_3247501 [Trichonephila clavipes]|nr:hypothetical protein TNCV_3247501 [Trichonephila clavipes]
MMSHLCSIGERSGFLRGQDVEDYDALDDKLPICATEVEEIVDLLEPMNGDSNAEIASETPIKTVPFSNVLHCSETVKTYLSYATGCK